MMKAKPRTASDARLSLTAAPADNVATLLDDLVESTRIADGTVISRGIPFGHKVALCDIAAGDDIVKYGVVIGHAKAAIRMGEHVHVHNIA